MIAWGWGQRQEGDTRKLLVMMEMFYTKTWVLFSKYAFSLKRSQGSLQNGQGKYKISLEQLVSGGKLM